MYKVLIFVSLVLGTAASALSVEAATQATGTAPLSQAKTEATVREFFKDTPVMIEIARCESNFRQFTDAGNLLRGGAEQGMVGVFQFYESIHASAAKKLGFDITTLKGNLNYAKYVYQSQGTTPWESARYCWETKNATPTLTNTQLRAKIKQLTELITLLQKLQALRQK